ncbi:latent-transforming growth factor beta-binding protein 2-like [Mugil cephalus]|uniref:latent-transforming growth factor beta-binding protein 2-like n=1 Tax=Mugil cephalus TaxID=48193 RepID=UPI001FB84F02|nr:latent-transforming growth factor beta-binding protein 2-like [Mugil cephalus]
MRVSVLLLWTSGTLTLFTAALEPPRREDGVLQPGRRRHRTGAASNEKPGVRRRAALSGPRVCGDRCCVGWTLSPKTRRCTKPSCSPLCRNGASCRLANICVCRPGFHGNRCQFPTATVSKPGRPTCPEE